MNNKTLKKIFIALLIIFIILPLFCGCWNYVGLNEIAIVLGVAIDKEKDNYNITFETVDLTNVSKDSGPQAIYIESEGKTVFEAVRNAKSRLQTRLFFGHIQIVIVNEQIAKEDGILNCLDLFLRDAESRETINIVISQGETAKDILTKKGIASSLNSLEIKEIIKKDHVTVGKTADIQLYQLYDVLFAHRRQPALPAFHSVNNNDTPTTASNGIAVFKKDKLIGYLSSDDTFYYLIVINELKGGVFSVQLDKNCPDSTVFEINTMESKIDYNYDKDDDRFKITLDISTQVFLAECEKHRTQPYDRHNIDEIEKKVEVYLKKEITNVISKVQNKYKVDIFGFGNIIYRKDPDLYRQVSKDWDRYFKELDVEIKPHINIKNTAFFRN